MADAANPFMPLGPEDAYDSSSLSAPGVEEAQSFASSVYGAMQPATALAAALQSAGLTGSSSAYGGSGFVAPSGQQSTAKYPGVSTDSNLPPWVTNPQQIPYPQTYYTGASTSMDDDRVYFGKEEVTGHDPYPEHVGDFRDNTGETAVSSGKEHKKAGSITVSAAMNRPYMWDDDKVNDVMKKMRESGLNVQSFDDMMGVWQSMVTRASKAFTMSRGKREVTPWDILSSIKKENIANGSLTKDGKIVQTQVNKTVNDLSNGDAWATLRSAMQGALGRKPTDQEVRDFLSKANNAAAQDPSVTHTTTTTDAESGQSHTTSSTNGGFTSNDAAQMATDQLENSDEFAQVQSATTYMNALLSALGETAG